MAEGCKKARPGEMATVNSAMEEVLPTNSGRAMLVQIWSRQKFATSKLVLSCENGSLLKLLKIMPLKFRGAARKNFLRSGARTAKFCKKLRRNVGDTMMQKKSLLTQGGDFCPAKDRIFAAKHK